MPVTLTKSKAFSIKPSNEPAPVIISNFQMASFTPRGNSSACVEIEFLQPLNGFNGANLDFTYEKPLFQNYVQDGVLHIFFPLECLDAVVNFLTTHVVPAQPESGSALFYFNATDLQNSIVLKLAGA